MQQIKTFISYCVTYGRSGRSLYGRQQEIAGVIASLGRKPWLEIFDKSARNRKVVIDFLNSHELTDTDALVVSEYRDIKHKAVAPRLVDKSVIVASVVTGNILSRGDVYNEYFLEHVISNKYILTNYVSSLSHDTARNDEIEKKKNDRRYEIWRLVRAFLENNVGSYGQDRIADKISIEGFSCTAADISDAIAVLGCHDEYMSLRRAARGPKELDNEVGIFINAMTTELTATVTDDQIYTSDAKEFIRVMDECEIDWAQFDDHKLYDEISDIFGDDYNKQEKSALLGVLRKMSA